MVDRKPPSIYDYWQALNIIEEEVKSEKEQIVRPTSDEWRFLNNLEDWVKKQKARIFVHLNKYFKDAELLLEVLNEGVD